MFDQLAIQRENYKIKEKIAFRLFKKITIVIAFVELTSLLIIYTLMKLDPHHD